MKILLAVDMSECSDAALEAVLSQFAPKTTEVRVFHALDWEHQLAPPYMFAQGREAARDFLTVRDRLLGSVSERIVRHAPCSVEVVRPAARQATSPR
jgi:nucleotide-binding universal stress UspA family protein